MTGINMTAIIDRWQLLFVYIPVNSKSEKYSNFFYSTSKVSFGDADNRAMLIYCKKGKHV